MNKISVDKEKNIEVDVDSFIVFNEIDNINVKVINKSNIFVYIDKNVKINFDINSNCNINLFCINSSASISLNLNKENTSINYNYSTINLDNNDYTIDINHNCSDTKSLIVSHGLNLSDKKLDFLINTNILKNSINSFSNQDSIIILKGKNRCIIKPNLLVDNSEIDANHSAYIGAFKDSDLFYLLSRGISKDRASLILAKAFLLDKMTLDYEEKELIINKLYEYWR